MKMSKNLTWFLNEHHRGAEMLCDHCNDMLDPLDKWYYRCVPDDEYAHSCICTKCAKKMTLQEEE